MRVEGQDVAKAAVSFVGTPVIHQGRQPGVGLDCVGVIVCAHRAAGADIEDVTNYRRGAPSKRLLREMDRQFAEVDDVAVGDVFLLRRGANFRHLSIYVGIGQMVHSDPCAGRSGLVVSVPVDPAHTARIYRWGKVNG